MAHISELPLYVWEYETGVVTRHTIIIPDEVRNLAGGGVH